MNILTEIATHSRDRLASTKKNFPLRTLEDLPLYAAARLDPRLYLRSDYISVIAEFKRRSPSAKFVKDEFGVRDVVMSYESNGASAISVLTEPTYFGGSLDDLSTARRACSIPLLRKDFVVDEYQLVEARAHGADMVLLIAAVLDKQQMFDLVQVCHDIGLEPLVELYEIHELDMVPVDNVSLIGANNRDLRNFEMDLTRAPAILSHVPDDKIKIAESGLTSAKDLRQAHDQGIHAALVGSCLMQSDNQGGALADLLSVETP